MYNKKEKIAFIIKVVSGTAKKNEAGAFRFYGESFFSEKTLIAGIKKYYKANPSDLESDFSSYMC